MHLFRILRIIRAIRNSAKGFTLMEALVSVTVFAVAMTSIMGIYLSVQRLNQRSAALQALQQNARFIMEDVAKIVRSGGVDYASYPGGTVPQPTTDDLYLLNQEGEQIHIYKEGDKLRVTVNDAGPSDLTGGEVSVSSFNVYIVPAQDPFAPGVVSRTQPIVTIYLEMRSFLVPGSPMTLPVQTTVTTKQYPILQ